MRKGVVIALCLTGCGGLFEVNPEYGSTGEVGESSGDGVATSAPASISSSSSASTDTADPSSGSSSSGSGSDSDAPTTCDEDPYEPNDEGQTGNANLGDLTGQSPIEITANIATSADEDWFKTGLNPPGAVQPSPVGTVASDTDLEVCMYIGCAMGEPVVDCGAQQTDSTGTAGSGNPGCCGIGSARVLSYSCEGAVELTGNAYARIRALEPIEACVPYAATFESE